MQKNVNDTELVIKSSIAKMTDYVNNIVMKETNPMKKNASLKIQQMKKQDCCQKKKKEASSEV